MRTICTALIVPARTSEPVRVQNIDVGQRALEDLVGGEIETVTRGDWDVCLNSDGVIANLPPNLRAAELMRDCGLDLADAARGTVVFLGRGTHGEPADAPGHLVKRAQDLYGARLAA
ncbi:protein of unknown function [Arthrobacter sp. 49Tsu3.1M3]|nr:protein of unknown function [Arthrobacter sp. 49Tsu3.1M3]